MKHSKLFSFIIIGSMFLSTALFAQKVNTDYDKKVDFTSYNSVSFLGWQDDITLTDFDKKRFTDAFIDQFKQRNMELVESGGDIIIALFIVAEQKTSTTAYTSYYGGGGRRGYGRGGRGGWGGGYSSTNYSESDYLQGTVVMDVFDGASKEQVWQAVATKTVSEKPEKREKSIPKGVKKIMKKFPIAPAK